MKEGGKELSVLSQTTGRFLPNNRAFLVKQLGVSRLETDYLQARNLQDQS